ncbi:caspase, EACC1-associated type [Nocardia wallacei]|uniref:caspase, EACC1-associated type n=1 Tax=Nocardia wallacei TaxID=480035 RepID=UPI00245518A8|nr:AAA domain-containing protein [Nocardia wallacei]
MTRLSRRRALLIGNETYTDSRFEPLPSVQTDIWQLEQVLAHRQIGGFGSVNRRVDLTCEQMCAEIATFLAACEEDELALLYVSGHGERLVQTNGEFHFVATDTDFDRIADTGVSAGFINDQLELCVAPQKVVMIDSCLSGGFALGLRTADSEPALPTAKGRSDRRSPLESSGVYVLSSSRASEVSRAGRGTPEGPEPSVFTGVVVEALRTGAVGKDGTGQVSVQDLFEYTNRHMRSHTSQVPVLSAIGVDDRIILASCPQGPAPTLAPLSSRPAKPVPTVQGTGSTQPSWSMLLEYYRSCLLTDQYEVPWLSVDDHGTTYVCLSGTERILCGQVDADHCIAVPQEAADLVGQAAEADDELWAGYPAMLTAPRDKRKNRIPNRFAPLLIRRVELVETGGERRLQPIGPVLAHPALAQECLGAEEAALFNDTYRPGWQRNQHDRMGVEARRIADEFELGCVQEPQPDQLFDHIDIDTPLDGGRNAAVLFRVSRHPGANGKLLSDLADIEKRSAAIRDTALAALSPDPVERIDPPLECDPSTVRPVTPLSCNEAQEAVIRSAMSRRLTVATGPPGTGKSQLVANLVATAVAAGQSVLVASTNNTAVDEVWERCCSVVPNSVIRTGNVETRRTVETKALEELRTSSDPETNIDTASMYLHRAVEARSEWRDTLACKATHEAAQLRTGQDRENYAAELGMSVPELSQRFSRIDPQALARKAAKAGNARFFGEWRRIRLLKRWDITVKTLSTVEACMALDGFGTAENAWRKNVSTLSEFPTDDDLSARDAETESRVSTAAAALFSSVMGTRASDGRSRIAELLRNLRSRDEWKTTRAALPAIPAWAVTNLSARRFPPDPALFDLVVVDEASQCAIPHVLPLLFRARRALVIGDPMQLEHIADITADDEARAYRDAGIEATWLEHRRLAYRRHSTFRAAERAVGQPLLLDEHFRCHPHIAALANNLFYDGKLTVMTDVRRQPSLPRPAVIWVPTDGRAEHPRSSKSWINGAEIAKVEECVRFLFDSGNLPTNASVGVVTPYRAQADAIRSRLGSRFRDHVEVGTVHVFQGGERDVMIFSLVAGPGMPARSVNRIDNQLNLWNVAITRARSHLVVVGDKELWRSRRVGGALLDAAESGKQHGRSTAAIRDPLLVRLFEALDGTTTAKLALGDAICGYDTDAVIANHDGSKTAYLLDRGPGRDDDPARHLRLMLRRIQLRTDPDHRITGIRTPAWQLYERPDQSGSHSEK